MPPTVPDYMTADRYVPLYLLAEKAGRMPPVSRQAGYYPFRGQNLNLLECKIEHQTYRRQTQSQGGHYGK